MTTAFAPAPPQPLHPQCVQMHKLGYCVCTMVDCGYCDMRHPPHKPCVAPPTSTPQTPEVP